MGFHMIWGNVTHLAPALLNWEVIIWKSFLGLPSMLEKMVVMLCHFDINSLPTVNHSIPLTEVSRVV